MTTCDNDQERMDGEDKEDRKDGQDLLVQRCKEGSPDVKVCPISNFLLKGLSIFYVVTAQFQLFV